MVIDTAEFFHHFAGEGDYLEFKQGVSTQRVQEAVVAFSNTDGGVVLFGIGDDGTLHGMPLDGELTARLHRIVAGVQNPGRYQIGELLVGAKRIPYLSIERRHEGVAQTPNGAPLVRRGAMNVPLMGEDLEDFVSRRRLRRFELTEVAATVDDVSSPLLDQLVEAWGWSSGDDVVNRLRERGLVARGSTSSLTAAGALYLLEAPEQVLGKAYIEVFRYRDAGSTYDKRIEIRGPAHRQVEAAVAEVMSELGTDLVILGTQRFELSRLPERVVREAVANAVAHRNYEIGRSTVRIELRPENVRVLSPGGLPEPVTVENIREQSAARNVHVIDTLRRFGLAEDAGRGIDVIEDTMQEQLLDRPTFEDDGSSVTVTLPLGTTVAPEERAWVSEIERRGQIRPPDRVLVVHAARGEVLTNQYVRDLLGVDSVDARSALQRLRDAGFLEQSGSRGGAQYRLAGDLAPPAGLRLDPEALGDLVVRLAQEGPVTNALVRQRTGLDRAQALALLSALVEEGRLERRGERRGARYVRPDAPPFDLS
jgi:ATP-dependent DNA helicase RecG